MREPKIGVPPPCNLEPSLGLPNAQAEQWLMENRAAMDRWNEQGEQCGVPRAEFRRF